MSKKHSKKLLVEGKEELRVIPQLIEAYGIPWGTRSNPIVYISEDCNGYEQLIDPDVITTELQDSNLSALGIIIDADEHPDQRWQSLRNACLNSIPDLPETLPETGLIHQTSNSINFGIWMMPDNKIRGMLETFLTYMIPNDGETLWEFAQETVNQATTKGAKYKAVHRDKANIYTWLAWQDPPGRQLHQAIMQKILQPGHPNGEKFFSWFRDLYSIEM